MRCIGADSSKLSEAPRSQVTKCKAATALATSDAVILHYRDAAIYRHSIAETHEVASDTESALRHRDIYTQVDDV